MDRLLASPQYGERWGRHWMDVWRYSDWWGLGQPRCATARNTSGTGATGSSSRSTRDKGYDQMIREMLAADELYRRTTWSDLARPASSPATYFLFNRNTWLEETVEHTGKAFLGLTLNCAKCHDHKYDPIAPVGLLPLPRLLRALSAPDRRGPRRARPRRRTASLGPSTATSMPRRSSSSGATSADR